MKIQKTEIMLYVNDTEQSMKFWRDQIGMTEIEQRVGPGGSHAFAISQHGMNVSFVLLDKELVRQYSPEISCSTPSIMFHTEDLQKTHDTMKAAGVTVTEIFCMGDMRTFSFCDCDGNYYAVS